MLLWVGLGNPGEKYQKQRHNIGFMIVEKIASQHSFAPWKNKMKARICEGEIAGQKIILLKPQLYMNKSGEPLSQVARFYKISLDSIYVFYDDIDLKPGKVKIKNGGGHGGHNGLRNIDESMGKNYWRIRTGIGRPANKELVQKWVLNDFSSEEQQSWLNFLLQVIATESNKLAKRNPELFMSRVSLLTNAETKFRKENQITGDFNGI